jgi:hypothetical protein
VTAGLLAGFGRAAGHRVQLAHAQGLAHLVLDLAGQLGVLAQEFAALSLPWPIFSPL